jgi:hypothetical protein
MVSSNAVELAIAAPGRPANVYRTIILKSLLLLRHFTIVLLAFGVFHTPTVFAG